MVLAIFLFDFAFFEVRLVDCWYCWWGRLTHPQILSLGNILLEILQILHKSIVRLYAFSLTLQEINSFIGKHIVFRHEVGNYNCGRTRNSRMTMHKNISVCCQIFLNESYALIEVLGQVVGHDISSQDGFGSLDSFVGTFFFVENYNLKPNVPTLWPQESTALILWSCRISGSATDMIFPIKRAPRFLAVFKTTFKLSGWFC